MTEIPIAGVEPPFSPDARSGAAGACLRSLGRRLTDRARKLSLLSLVAMMALAGFAPSASAANPKTFATGSLIIPMDTKYQNNGMFKAYGLVYKLLQSGVPVYWLIADGKAFNGIDFTVAAKDHYAPFAAIGPPSPYTYTGGPFVIDQSNVAVADPIITAWRNANGANPALAVHETTAALAFPDVQIILQSAPRIALETINAGIAIAYFNAAGIPDGNGNPWTLLSPNLMTQAKISGCSTGTCTSAAVGDGALFSGGACSARKYDVFVTPHNGGYSYSTTDPLNIGTQTYAELDYFVSQGGGWIAMCHSILSNENAITALYNSTTPSVRNLFTAPSNGGFLTQSGFTTISNVGGTWTVQSGVADLPIAQAVPTTVANGLPGGSVQDWPAPAPANPVPPAGAPSYWTQTERIASFVTSGGVQYDWALNGAWHNGEGQGKMTFLGGHSYSTALPYSTNYEAPYLRFFYNSLFFNSAAVANMTLVPSPTTVPQGNSTAVQLAFKNTGASPALGVGALSVSTITLASGVSYVSMASGPTPTVTVNGDGTTTLAFAAGSIGDVAGGASALVVNTKVFFATLGTQQVASLSGKYGDMLQESFVNNSCASVLVAAAPGTVITKTPASTTANVGDIVAWTLSYSNPGASGLTNPVVEDVLPSAFTYVSASPAPTYVVPVAGGTKLHWTLASPLASGGSGSITLRAAVQTNTGQPFTNTASLAGSDASGTSYSATATASVSVNPPLASIAKTVSPTGTVAAGATLTYTLSPSAPGPTLLNNLRFYDAPPVNTTYVNNSVAPSNLGSFGAYVPLAGVPGTDTTPDTTMTLSEGASPFTYAIGDTLTVTIALNNAATSTGAITGVTASLTPSDGASTCVPLSAQPVATIAVNSTANITFTCTIGSSGEITWDGAADGTFAGGPYSFATGTSPSVLGVPTTTGTNVVQWKPSLNNDNTPAVPSSNFSAGSGPGLFAFNGTANLWERYDIANNAWITSPAGLTNNLPATVGDGAALAYDGTGYASGYVFALRGGGTSTFWRYQLSNATGGTWTAAPPAAAPWNVGAGGALTLLGGYLYALQGGNTTGFARYNLATATWSPLANVTGAVGAGGALATDGTYVYALRGNNTKTLYRYNPATNTWATMANASANVNPGGALTAIGTTLYAMLGNNSNHFAKFVPNATNGKWTGLKNVPANVGAGGALATDGTYVYAFRGNNTTTFYRFDPAKNAWTTLANTQANIRTGGAMTWVPGGAGSLNGNSLSAPVLVTGSNGSRATIQLTQTLTSSTAVNGVTPTSLTVVSSNAFPASGTPAANCTVSPNTAQNIGAGGTLVFTWTCTNVYTTQNNANQNLGMLTFSAGATGTSPASTWTSATANSVLVTQPLTYQVTVNAAPTTFTQVTNQALLSDDVAFESGVGSTSVVTPISRPPSLALTKSVSPASGTQVNPGDTLTYTVALLNISAGAATAVSVTDAVPAGTTYVGCTASQGTCAQAGGTVTYTLGAMAGYGTASLTMTVNASVPTFAGNATIANTANTSYTGTGCAPCTGASNTVQNPIVATPTVTIAKAEAVDAGHGPDANGAITPGATITYTMAVNNPAGAVIAQSVVATDLVPAGTTYVSCATSLGSCAQAGGTVTYTLGTMPPPTTANLTLVVTVNSPAADGGSISNSASVSAATNITGTTYAANSNIVSYQIAAAPIVAVSKSASPVSGTDVKVGDVIVYTLTVSNTGTANTQSAYVIDAIPAGTTYIANTTCLNGTLTPPGASWTCAGANGVMVPELTPGVPPTAGSLPVYSPGQGDADGGTLVVGSPATVSFAVTVNGTPDPTNPSGVILNQATAGTATTAPVPSNTTTHTKRTNLGITKTGPLSVGSTDPVAYTIVASNSGPSSADGAVIADPAVANFAADTATCGTPVNGAVCPSGLTLAQLQAGVAIPTFPANSSLTFTVSGYPYVSTTATQIDNVATLVAPTGIADGNSGSNPTHSATQSTTVDAFPTLALISGVRGYVEGGSSWFEWETASEVRTAGFNVLRWDAARGDYVQVNARLLPALIGARHGGVYRYADPAASPGGTYTYGLEEVEITGRTRVYGPYTVTYGARRPVAAAQKAQSPAVGARADRAGPAGYERKARAAIGRTTTAVALAATQPQAAGAAPANTAVRILVEQDGLYTVTADQIAAALGKSVAQVKTWIAKTQLRLQQKGQAVAWYADPAGDKLYFYGQALQGVDAVYTRYNVYWLDQAAGVAMKVLTGRPPAPASATQSFPSSIGARQYVWAYTQFTSDPDADFWYWDTAVAFNPGLGARVPFAVPAPGAAGSGSATIRAYLQGASDLIPGNDHHAHVYVNGSEVDVGAATWDGIAPKVLTGNFDASLLKTDGSANTVEVAAELDSADPGVYSVIEVARFELDYPRYYQAADDQLRLRGAGNAAVTVRGFSGPGIAVLNVSDPLKPQWVAATSVASAGAGTAVTFAPATPASDYLAAIAKAPVSVEGDAPSTLKSTNTAAAYLVLTPSALRDGADALAAYRGAKVVDLRDIYDEFNYGIANPHAIHDFLAYAATKWRVKPKFVALLGKGSFDPKDYLGGHTNLFPMLMAPTPDGLYPADNRFADFNDDGVPDMAIGRIPALTNHDVTQYLAKVQAYESSTRRPANQALVLADNPDEAGNFTRDSQEVAQALAGKGFVPTPVYLDGMTADAARAQIASALNAPAGVGLFTYVGHGGTNQLADENLLANDVDPGLSTLNALRNASRQPIFMAFTCAVGDGSYPGYDSLVESLLWRQVGGAVAAFAPSALSDDSQAHKLNLSVVAALGGPTSRPTLGEAAAAAIADFARKGGPRYMRDVYSVHGDPGLRIQQ